MSTDSKIESVRGRWALLRANPGNNGGLEVPSFPTEVRSAYGDVRLSIGDNGEPRLLLPLGPKEVVKKPEAGAALELQVSTFTTQAGTLRFLDIKCLSRELETVFEEVSGEILLRISKGEGCLAATRTTLDDFRTLLLAPDAGGAIDRSRIVGLVAELLVLNRTLDLSPSGWRAWSGPRGDRHDFRNADRSLEVKASTRGGSTNVTINGLNQLEAPSGGRLHLAHLVLEPVKGGPLSVGSLGSKAMDKSDDPGAIRSLLAALGCPDVHAESWNRESFRLESETIFEVKPGFPRITPSTFAGGTTPVGVVDATYEIDLLHANTFRCNGDEINALLSDLVK